jgi:hypothetical protein
VPQAAAIAMARPSGLERRITAILDGRRNRAHLDTPTYYVVNQSASQ